MRYPNVYGIDMPSVNELVANGRNEEQIREEIGADRVIYQDLKDLIDSGREGNPSIKQFDASCFDAVYVTGDVNQEYLNRIEQVRSDAAKRRKIQNHLISAEPHTYS